MHSCKNITFEEILCMAMTQTVKSNILSWSTNVFGKSESVRDFKEMSNFLKNNLYSLTSDS